MKRLWPPLRDHSLLLLALAVLAVHTLYLDFLNDDSYISFRYAWNLAHHGQLVYNLGEAVEGYTNFLWTLLLAGTIAVGLDVEVMSRVLGGLFGAGGLVLIFAFSRYSHGRSTPYNGLGSLFLAVSSAYACWCSGGLETQLFTFLVAGGGFQYLREVREERRFRLSALWFALAAMTRPEGLMIFGLTGIHAWSLGLVRQRKILPSWPLLAWAGLFVLAYGPYFLWRYDYYGYPFPNTFYVKSGGAALWGSGLRYTGLFVFDNLLWLFLPLAFLPHPFGNKPQERATRSYFALLLGAFLAYITYVGGDFMGLYRFFVPMLPFWAFLVQEGVLSLHGWSLHRGWARPATLFVAEVALVLALVGWNGYLSHEAMKPTSEHGVDRIGWLKDFAQQCSAIGKWLAQNSSPEDSIAVTAAGAIAFHSRLYALDQLGLNDTYIAHKTKAVGTRPGHNKFAPHHYLMAKKVSYIINHPMLTEGPTAPHSRDRQFWGSQRPPYRWKSVRIPGMNPPYFSFWVRQGVM